MEKLDMKECIVLAGGLGTRLQSVVKDVPKSMAKINEQPFLEYLYKYLLKEEFDHVVLALGYKADYVLSWLKQSDYHNISSFVIEQEALGTGGAIALALDKIKGDKAYIINGDTFFNIDTDKLWQTHHINDADISIALKPLTNFDRYGSVSMNTEKRILKFNEKKFCKKGDINGGIYLLNKELISQLKLPRKFSFEKEILEKRSNDLKIFGNVQDEYFIDIGIPVDYEKANRDFAELF